MKQFFLGIDHPAIAADNVIELADWYCTTFGYTVFSHNDTPVFILQAPDGTLLEVMPADQSPRPLRNNNTQGLSHLALKVSDFDQAVHALDQHGVQWAGEEIKAAGNGRLRNLIDPEGNSLQIIQR
jgi:glyoxylase I family protein